MSNKTGYKAFGEELIRLRKAIGIGTQKELSQLLGFTQQTVSRWEAGISRPRASEILAVATALNASSQTLLLAAGYAPQEQVNVCFDRPLPLATLSPESFERFALDFLAVHLGPTAKVHPAGKSGHKQDGLDIDATFIDGRTHTFQCKREAAFGAAKVAKAIKAHIAKADEKVILLSRVASPAARTEAKKHPGWDIWDQEDISRKFRSLSKVEQLRLVDVFFPGQRFALLGESSPGPWATAADFFAPLLAEGRIFNHRWQLVGRVQELGDLERALADPTRVVVQLVGTAGGGKSRVLRAAIGAFAQANPGVLLRVLSPTEQVSAKSLEDLGHDEKLLVVDDAHDRGSDLGHLIRYVADERNRAKLLLVFRPYAEEVIARDLAEVGLSGSLVAQIALTRPTKKDAIALATQVLEAHAAPTDAAQLIADLAYDSPLAVVVGAHIVAKDRVHPERFGSHKEFRSTVLKRYEKVIAEDIAATGKDQERVLRILRVLALIQPVAPDDRHVLALLESAEQIHVADASRLVKRLIEGGVLFKRGVLYRLSPDLLADSIIETACIASAGESNGYAERVFTAAIPEHKQHLLLNLGRLDWRRNEGDTSESRLLDGLWATLKWEDDYRHADVRAAAEAAYYQPRQALDFAQRLVHDGHGQNQDVCRIIRNAAYNLKYVADACALLWEAGRSDDRPTNRHPEHPVRLLTELATPEPRKPVEYCEAVVDFVLSLLSTADAWHGTLTPFDVLAGALATEGHFTSKATSRAVTLSSYGVDRGPVVAMRARIVDAVLESLTSDNKRRAFCAAKLVATAVHGPIGLLNRSPSADERTAWELEFVQTLNRIADLAERAHLSATMLVAVAHSVAWHAYHPEGLTKAPSQRILNLLARDLETRATRILVDGWGTNTWRLDVESKREAIEDAKEHLAAELDGAFPDAPSLAGFIDSRLAEIREYGGDGYGAPQIFLGPFIADRLNLAREVLSVFEASPTAQIARFSAVALSSLLQHAHTDAHALIDSWLTADASRLAPVAQAYAMYTRPLGERDRVVLRRIFESSDQAVLGYVSWIFRNVADHDKLFAIELLATANSAAVGATRHEHLMWLSDDKLVPMQLITDDQLARIVASLRSPDRLDDHWVQEFLQKVGARKPELVVDLVKARLEDGLSANDWSKDPVGIIARHQKSLGLCAHTRGPALFSDLLDWALPRIDDYRFAHRFSDLVHGVFGLCDDACLPALEAWFAAGGKEHFTVLAAILRDANPSFVWQHGQFVERALRAARDQSLKTHSNLTSALYACAVSGIRGGTPGRPFPVDLEMKARAEAQLAHLSRADPAYELYESLRKHAERDIERQMVEGRLMDEEEVEE